jgi:hypothetical protein
MLLFREDLLRKRYCAYMLRVNFTAKRCRRRGLLGDL